MNRTGAKSQIFFPPLALHSFGTGAWKSNTIIPLHGYVVLHSNRLCVQPLVYRTFVEEISWVQDSHADADFGAVATQWFYHYYYYPSDFSIAIIITRLMTNISEQESWFSDILHSDLISAEIINYSPW